MCWNNRIPMKTKQQKKAYERLSSLWDARTYDFLSVSFFCVWPRTDQRRTVITNLQGIGSIVFEHNSYSNTQKQISISHWINLNLHKSALAALTAISTSNRCEIYDFQHFTVDSIEVINSYCNDNEKRSSSTVLIILLSNVSIKSHTISYVLTVDTVRVSIVCC